MSVASRSSFVDSLVKSLPTLIPYGEYYKIVSSVPIDGIPLSAAATSFITDDFEYVYLMPKDNLLCYLLTYYSGFVWQVVFEKKLKTIQPVSL